MFVGFDAGEWLKVAVCVASGACRSGCECGSCYVH